MSFENKLDRPLLPQTPRESLGPLVRETVIVEGRTFSLIRPGESDRLLDDPTVRSNFALDEYMPYWADLWPGARMLGKYLLRQTWPTGLTALEVGCGLGLPGVVALSLGMHVIFSDYDATALEFAATNAEENGFTDFQTLQMDWRFPPADLRVPLLLASDLIYEMRNVVPLIRVVKHFLTSDGVCLLTDQDRVPMHRFRETLEAEDLNYTSQLMRAGEPGGRRVKGTLYRITLPESPATG
jgi:predicted nicotinamide N-methyase